MKHLTIKSMGKKVKFHPRHRMRMGHPLNRFRPLAGFAAVSLPIDWTKNDTLPFPMDDNDTEGDCMVAAAEHGDNTFTGNVGVESVFQDSLTSAWYLKLAGGDNGLTEGQIIQGWKGGLPGIPQATIIDALDVDPTNAAYMQSAIQLFGGTQFMLAVPDPWVMNFVTNYIWDTGTGITADENNGHGIWFNGVASNGNYKFQTWGSHGWITPAGVLICDPSAFVVFSLRWFNAAGYAPNGMHIATLAPYWVASGGNKGVLGAISQFPPPGPSPLPGATTITLSQALAAGTYTLTKQ